MCNADSTPVRLEWRKESSFLIPKFDQYHTCRNFGLLHDFSRKYALEKHYKENQAAISEAIKSGKLMSGGLKGGHSDHWTTPQRGWAQVTEAV